MYTFSPLNCDGRTRGIPGRTVAKLREQAFSLVEVTLAIGVVAFAFVSLMGLLPSGLSVFREAMDTTVTAQIAQRITSELQETDYLTLLRRTNLDRTTADPVVQKQPAYGTLPPRYFDDQGNEISPSTGGKLSREQRLQVLYEARVRLARDRQVLGHSPGGEDERLGTRNMTTAVIQVISNPAGKLVELDEETQLVNPEKTRLPIQTYPALVAGNGYELRKKGGYR